MHGNLSELVVAIAAYNMVLTSETLVSGRRHISELALPHLGASQLELHKSRAGVLGGWLAPVLSALSVAVVSLWCLRIVASSGRSRSSAFIAVPLLMAIYMIIL